VQCSNNEIEGMEFCLHHVPDDMLDEAEEVTGFRRCRHGWGTTEPSCGSYAVSGTDPPACKNHGANSGSVTSREGARRVVEGKAADRLAQIMAEHGEKLLNPAPIANSLQAHLDLAAEAWALKEILRMVLTHLFSTDRVRYAHSKVGEQLRMEVLLYERAVERLDRMLTNINRTKIEARLAAVSEARLQHEERAFAAALQAAQIPVERQEAARAVLRRELMKAVA
jgi:hypothetical protein